MNQSISNKSHWQQILTRQKLANAHQWLAKIKTHDDPTIFVSNDYDNFLRALETTLQSADSFDLAYQLIQSIYTIALDYADWERWLVYLENALETSKKLEREYEQAVLLLQIGDILYRMANLNRAEELYKEASQKFWDQKDQAGYANTLTKLAVLYNSQGKMQKGIDLCEQALNIAKQLHNETLMAQVYLYLSHIYHRSRNWEVALETAQKAYEYYTLNGDVKLARKALMNSTALWAELGKWQKANDVSKRLTDELTASGDIRTLSQLKNNLGVVAFNQKQYIVAEGFWQEALHLHSQIQEPTEQASLYNNLGVVYTLLEEWLAADDMLNKAILAHQELGDIYNWANSLDNLADLYEAQGETAVCRQVLEKAQTGLQTIAQTPHVEKLLDSITQRLASLPPN